MYRLCAGGVGARTSMGGKGRGSERIMVVSVGGVVAGRPLPLPCQLLAQQRCATKFMSHFTRGARAFIGDLPPGRRSVLRLKWQHTLSTWRLVAARQPRVCLATSH